LVNGFCKLRFWKGILVKASSHLTKTILAALTLGALLFVFVPTTLAQQNQTTEAMRQQIPQEQLEKAMSALQSIIAPVTPYTGKGKDVFLMRKHKPFYVSAGQSFGATTNAFAQPDAKADVYSNSSLGLGADTVIDQAWAVRAGISLDFRRHANYGILDYDVFRFSSGVARSFGAFRYGFDYEYDLVTTSGFNRKLVASHRLLPSVSYTYVINKDLAVSATGRLTVTSSDPEDYDTFGLSLVIPAIYRLMPEVTLLGGMQMSNTWYHHFFPVFFEDARKDFQFGLFAAAVYQPKFLPMANIRVNLNYTGNYSTLGILSYHRGNLEPMAHFTYRFF
jgi:hypothetical protein